MEVQENAKRRRILDMLSRRSFSEIDVVAAFAALGDDAKAVSRREVRGCGDALTEDALVRLPLQRQNGDAFDWTTAKYQRLLPRCIAQCEGFRQEFQNAPAKTPNANDR
eukprot:7357043-Pyramimonas_sp.AAC.1